MFQVESHNTGNPLFHLGSRQIILSVYLVLPHCPCTAISFTTGSGMTYMVYCVGHVFVGVCSKWIGLEWGGVVASGRFVYLY